MFRAGARGEGEGRQLNNNFNYTDFAAVHRTSRRQSTLTHWPNYAWRPQRAGSSYYARGPTLGRRSRCRRFRHSVVDERGRGASQALFKIFEGRLREIAL